MTQQFKTTDLLRLEVEDDPTGLANLVQNPSGELGGWGWITPVAGASLRTHDTTPSGLIYTGSPTNFDAEFFYTEPMAVAAGQYVAASWVVYGGTSGYYYRVKVEWLDAAQAVIGTAPQSGYLQATSATQSYGPHLAPASTAYARLRFDMYANTSAGNPVGSNALYLRNVTVAKAATSGALVAVRTNLLTNPSWEVNALGWTVYDGGTARVSTPTPAVGSWCTRLSSNATAAQVRTASVAITGGLDYTFRIAVRAATTARSVLIRFRFLDASSAVVGTATNTFTGETTSTWGVASCTATAPASATQMTVEVSILSPGSDENHYLDAAMLEQASSPGTYFDGATADAGGWDYSWTGTAHASTSTATSSNLAYIEPVPYLNVLGPTHDIKVVREALNVGTLESNILDATLDPSKSDVIRPGRRTRLTAYDGTGWKPMFTGKASRASVTYDYKTPGVPDPKRARIAHVAVDPLAALSQQKREEGVATLAELPYVLEGCGVPWNVNGSGNQVASATVVSRNENASAVDQIAVTRDTNLAHAWVDPFGVMQVWDAAGSAPSSLTLTRADYVDINVDYDTERCINEVTIKYLRLNPATGDTEEVPYGPYRDEASITEWGVRSASFTIHGISEETSDIPDLAAAILAANATPQVRANSVTVAMETPADVVAYALGADLYSVVTVEKPDGLGDFDDARITRIEHTITPTKWLVTFGFETNGSVAAPTYVPSPTIGAGGKTIGQLLRPVGEVTMWFGAKADIPAGWLALDGTTFSGTTYPDLAALLGSTTLPDMTDRFPIGAGTKALGTSGGAATKALVAANLPPHTHTIAHTHEIAARNAASGFGGSPTVGTPSATGTLTNINTLGSSAANSGNGPGTSTPVDILNPWRSLWFIIRAA